MLVLEVEFLLGRYWGAETQFDEETDFPPKPDRAFSALVHSWAHRGRLAAEENALRWLESQKPPTVRASAHTQPAVALTAFVPVNDRAVGLNSAVPYRTRQERPFPVASPDDSIMTYSWETADPKDSILESLQALAGDVSYLGRSSS